MEANLKKYVIVVAGGVGKRMGSSTPKQFIMLGEKPLLIHTIERFKAFDASIRVVVVLPADQIKTWEGLCTDYNFNVEHLITEGGDRRFFSVKNGLKHVTEKSLVAVHDGVRPLVSTDTIKRCFDMAAKRGNAVPVIEPPESVREIEESGSNRRLDRKRIRLVQTPQVFNSDLLLEAYDCTYSTDFTDDATVVERLGIKIDLVEGNIENIKITTPMDLIVAEKLLEKEK